MRDSQFIFVRPTAGKELHFTTIVGEFETSSISDVHQEIMYDDVDNKVYDEDSSKFIYFIFGRT